MSGCVTKVNLDIGETDYRVAVPEDGGTTLIKKYETLADEEDRIIRKDESISIYLKQIHIANFSERLEKFLAATWTTTVRGEIAVIVRAFELKDGETLDWRKSAVKGKGRLVYYSEDVRTGGHMLNGSMLPVYGPITYGGNPVVVELTVLELDVGEAQQTKALLSALATLGSKAYAPASPILETLDTLGSELLSGEQDDIEMRYVFMLLPEGGHSSTTYPKVEVGDYVLVRQSPRVRRWWWDEWIKNKGIIQGFAPIPWEDLDYDPLNGRLICKEDDDPNDKEDENNKPCNRRSDREYREKTYAVFNVNSGIPSVGLDTAQLFSEFQAEAEQEVSKAGTIEALSGSIDKFKEQAEATNERKTIRERYTSAVSLHEAMCTDAANSVHYATSLFDILINKVGFPTEDDGTKKDFNDEQWQGLVEAFRERAKKPQMITKDALSSVGDIDALRTLAQCDRTPP